MPAAGIAIGVPGSSRNVPTNKGLHHLVGAVCLGPGLAGPLVFAVREDLDFKSRESELPDEIR